MSEDFFVGYLDVPKATARRMKRVALALVVLAAAVATVLALATGPFDRGTFEFGVTRDWRGRIEAQPVPVLIATVADPNAAPFGRLVRYPLVAPGKHGAAPLVASIDGAFVKLTATRIAREGTAMLEVVPGSIVVEAPKPPHEAVPVSHTDDLGRSTFTGEIVDSKCFLGVMNPGRLEVHRACALRCIAGGIMPMLFARDSQGREAHLILVGENGEAMNDRVADFVARPATVAGRLERRDGLYYLYVASLRRAD